MARAIASIRGSRWCLRHSRHGRGATFLTSRLRTLQDVLEQAGQRLARREQQAGPIQKLHGYAWVTVRSIATSALRRGTSRLIQQTLPAEASAARLASTPSTSGTADDVEGDVFLKELLATLSPDERLVYLWKKAGFSSREIAQFRGCSVGAIDTMLSRLRTKRRLAIGPHRRGER